jgi:glycosyltransferase involved in cell wall biosynthesis
MFKFHFLYNDGEVEYLKSIGFKNKLMIGMNNGIDQSKIDEEIERWSTERLSAWRVKTIGSERQFDLITLGRLLTGKYEFLINAIVDLRKDIPDIKCCIVGDGVGRKDLENLAIKMDVQSNIYFAGALYLEQDLAPYLLSAKMLVHPTAMGLTIMHGFGYGLPVITHDDYKYHGPEIIAHKDMENGLLYKNGDLVDFNMKIKQLYFDNELRNKFSKNAKDLVTKKYNTSQMASNFFKLLSELK